ncbi:hypothetical protein HMPREF1415_00318 [Helicobacter pylori GAM254Ai]|nr:hypothetical protein HMPREF1415_00318 [Helicobacter pylori GAM254Ai]
MPCLYSLLFCCYDDCSCGFFLSWLVFKIIQADFLIRLSSLVKTLHYI